MDTLLCLLIFLDLHIRFLLESLGMMVHPIDLHIRFLLESLGMMVHPNHT